MLSDAKPANAILEQAAEWYAVLRGGEASDRQQAAWRQWIDASEEHRTAWRYVEQISNRFAPLQDTPDPKRTVDKLQQVNTRLQQRRRILTGIVGIAGTGMAAWLGWRHTTLPGVMLAWQADHHTGIGEQMNITLPDGSRAWLNTGTAVNLDFSPTLRRISLLAGEVFIETAEDVARPFVVDTDHGRLRALGTRFNVYQRAEDTSLAVYEGAVEIRTNTPLQKQRVHAGRQVRFTTQTITPTQFVDSTREAWRRGVFVAEDIPLRELVEELRRYRPGHIGLADEIADLEVYGNFPIRNTDQVLGMLTSTLPVRINQTLPWWVSIEPR